MSGKWDYPGYHWTDRQPWRRFMLAHWSFVSKCWHPKRKWYARARAFYLSLIGWDTEVCSLCGGRVRVVFHVPNAMWRESSGCVDPKVDYRGYSLPGVLCVYCFNDLAGWPIFWTCSRDESEMVR